MPIEVNQQYSIDVPTAKKAYIVPQAEWQRVRRLVKDLAPYHNLFRTLWPLCAGISVSMIGILFTLWTAAITVPAWVWTLTWTVAAAALVAGIICFYSDFQHRKSVQHGLDGVLEEMTALEQSCQPESRLTNAHEANS